ncbi:MAG: hypothetical protein JWQ06_1652, partial [Mucilaginibacter sp.]|nr:hypothetical protein [Mucilaginibacter sp.]
MKQTIFTLLLFSALGLLSCRKNTTSPNIEQQDQNQILSYISANGITGMKRDTAAGDTSGIYYQTILPGLPGTSYQYPDSIGFVYTIKSFDGKYNSLDTTINHFQGFAGHIYSTNLPYGLQLVIHDVLKKGGSMRVLIPSHLAYGVNGYGSGSSSNANSKISGNQCLDYYIHSINNEAAYDDLVITNFMAANSYTGFKRTPSGLYYKLNTPGTGTVPITNNTTVTMTYTGYLLNAAIFDQYNTADGSGTAKDIPDLIPGLQEGLKNYVTTGAYVSFLIPSTLAYGKVAQSSIPANSVLHFDIR